MPKRQPKVEIICKTCEKTFEVIQSRAESAKYCSNKCKGGAPIIRNCPTCGVEFKTCESLNKKFCSYSCIRKTDEQRRKTSLGVKRLHEDGHYGKEWKKRIGRTVRENAKSPNYVNPMQGRSRNDIWIEKHGFEIGTQMIEEYRQRCKGWSIFESGTTMEDRFGTDRAKEIKNKLSEIRKKDKSEFDTDLEYRKRIYRYWVGKYTNSVDLTKLENFNKRGKISRRPDAHHLDHIVSIIDGFENNIPPYIIGHVCNLRFISSNKNQSKQRKSSMSIQVLIKKINIYEAESYMP